jgi:EAL domain-containing protein (putative c-di-GMP-specific phosphodiesterase class I)
VNGTRRHFRAGETIFAEGDPPTAAFLIESGRVQISTRRHGDPQVVAELGPGELLGEMAVIDDAPRSASACAITDCVFLPIDRRQLGERVAAADPVVRALLLDQLGRYRAALAGLSGEASLPSPVVGHEAPAIAKIRLESELREALARGELEVHLQPIVEIGAGDPASLAGYEALLRWPHPLHGAISPVEFIALAEETSLIVPLGDFVLEQVCATLADVARRGRCLPFVSLNLSARQLHDPELIDHMLAKLAAHDLPASTLKLEVTESLLSDRDSVATLIARCHAVGMQVALDDFGTGWSNLGTLLTLEFDQVKLDRQFVEALATPRGKAVVAAIVALGAALGCDLIAEGVETAEQRDILRELGCRYAQGWLFGKPLAFEDALE